MKLHLFILLFCMLGVVHGAGVGIRGQPWGISSLLLHVQPGIELKLSASVASDFAL